MAERKGHENRLDLYSGVAADRNWNLAAPSQRPPTIFKKLDTKEYKCSVPDCANGNTEPAAYITKRAIGFDWGSQKHKAEEHLACESCARKMS